MPYLSISIKTLIRLKNLFLFILLFLFIHQAHSQDFWEQLNFPSDTLSIKCITTNDAGDIFLGLGDAYETGGVLRSTDNGESWELVYNYQFSVLSIACNDNGYIYIGKNGPDQFAVSKDNGNTWENIEWIDPYYGNVMSIYCKGQDTVYVSTWQTLGAFILFSFDSGESWEQIYVTDNHDEYISDIDITSDGIIYVSTMGYFFDQGGVYKSEDGGYTWDYVGLLNHQILALEINSNNDVFTTDWWVIDYNENPGIHALYNGTDEFVPIFASTDGRDLAINNEDEIYACVGSYEVYSQDDGQTFEFVEDDELPTNHLYNLHIDNENYIYGTNPKFIVKSIKPTTTGINTPNETIKKKIQIHPNPVGDMLNAYVDASHINNSTAIVNIYDVSGQLQYKSTTALTNNQLKTNTTHLTSGIYVLKIYVDNQIFTQKFIK